MLLPLLMQLGMFTATQGGGGGVPNEHPLPQKYSQQVMGEVVTLPQEPKSNEVAREVLGAAVKLEKRLPPKPPVIAAKAELKKFEWTPAPIQKIVPKAPPKPLRQTVLEVATDIEKRLDAGDMDFDKMLEEVDWMLRQVATYVESQQIYNLIRSLEMQIKAYRDS